MLCGIDPGLKAAAVTQFESNLSKTERIGSNLDERVGRGSDGSSPVEREKSRSSTIERRKKRKIKSPMKEWEVKSSHNQ